MRFSITGGSDVAGSAERAPFGLDQFDRSAVSDKAATYFPDPLTSEGADGRPCLTHDRLLDVLHYDPQSGVFTWLKGRRAGRKAGTITQQGYNQIKVDAKLYRANRLAIFYVTGHWPKNLVDHKNLMRSDDRFENLREATHSQNNVNRLPQSNNRSGRRGVYWQEAAGKWHVSVQHAGRRHYVGLFDTLEAASAAYDETALRLHGEFARPNSPQDTYSPWAVRRPSNSLRSTYP